MKSFLLLLLVCVVGCGKANNVPTCYSCGERVSRKAATCPHCGEPKPGLTFIERHNEQRDAELRADREALNESKRKLGISD